MSEEENVKEASTGVEEEMQYDEETIKKFGEEALKDPRVALLVQKYKEISQIVNQVGAWLNGKAEVNKDVSQEDHIKWLATRYCMDTIFLMEQLGVITIEEEPEEVVDEDEDAEPLDEEDEVLAAVGDDEQQEEVVTV
jgi:uncharacterized C2H2 Zn-finger protein